MLISEKVKRFKTVLLGNFTHQHPKMILLLILAFLSARAAQELVEEVQQPNCTRLLHAGEFTSEPSPTFPTTSFTCWDKYDGYYADIEVDCTIFHYCQTWQYPSGLNETVKWDFACPQSTIFNQKILSCTPPNISFDCQDSPNYYWVNYNLTFTTATPPPTAEFSNPVSNASQQLIVGGPDRLSVSVKDFDHPTEPIHFPEPSNRPESQSPNDNSLSEPINFPASV